MRENLRGAAKCRGMLRKVLMGKDGKDSVRVTTTLSRTQLEAVEHIASKNHVKVAWVVRQAVERLIEQAEGGRLLPFDWK